MAADRAESKDTVGIALVGNGFAADFHTENYKRVHGGAARLVGVYGPRPEAASASPRNLT